MRFFVAMLLRMTTCTRLLRCSSYHPHPILLPEGEGILWFPSKGEGICSDFNRLIAAFKNSKLKQTIYKV